MDTKRYRLMSGKGFVRSFNMCRHETNIFEKGVGPTKIEGVEKVSNFKMGRKYHIVFVIEEVL